MISEKTVELNLTTELINFQYYITGIRPYILAPSQRLEATYGFDVEIGLPNSVRPVLIQYKRAEYNTARQEYTYHLNRTSQRDQHLKLYNLEILGYEVYYALPLFHTSIEVINFRQRLLTITLFLKPSAMIPMDGTMTGHHEVKYNKMTNTLRIYSEEGKEIKKTDFFDFIRELNNDTEKEGKDLNSFFQDFNNVFIDQGPTSQDNINLKSEFKDEPLFQGLSIIII